MVTLSSYQLIALTVFQVNDDAMHASVTVLDGGDAAASLSLEASVSPVANNDSCLVTAPAEEDSDAAVVLPEMSADSPVAEAADENPDSNKTQDLLEDSASTPMVSSSLNVSGDVVTASKSSDKQASGGKPEASAADRLAHVLNMVEKLEGRTGNPGTVNTAQSEQSNEPIMASTTSPALEPAAMPAPTPSECVENNKEVSEKVRYGRVS